MKPHTPAALIVLAATAALAGAAPAAPPDPPTALRAPVAQDAAKVRSTSLTVPNVAGVPGEKRTLSAILKLDAPGGSPLEGKLVSMRVGSLDLKPGTTDAQGKATADLTVPDLAQGNYDIVASWKGDAGHKPATGTGKLTVIKAPTKIEMDFVYGTYKNEPGKYASFSAKVVRTHDNQVLKKPVTLTVNGSTRVMPATEYHNTALPDATTWVVKVQFEGDAAYAASAGEHTYHKPK